MVDGVPRLSEDLGKRMLTTDLVTSPRTPETECTYEGFQISVHSAVEVTRFLLQEGFEFVLTERFCQDPVEEYFGGQRKLSRRSDNPDIKTFG